MSHSREQANASSQGWLLGVGQLDESVEGGWKVLTVRWNRSGFEDLQLYSEARARLGQ